MSDGPTSAADPAIEAAGTGDPILDEATAPPNGLRRRRALELFLMFVAAPPLLAHWMRPGLVFPAIWTLAAICLTLLLRDPAFERRRLWNRAGVGLCLVPMLIRFVALAVLLAAALAAVEPGALLLLPRTRPGLWAAIMVGYPVLSVYAQELSFRAFFFHRYAALLPGKWPMIAASAAAFGFAHIILHNWVAIGLSTAGGILFGLTYQRTRSTLGVCIEHALYGCFLFTIGWGRYLYGGAMLG